MTLADKCMEMMTYNPCCITYIIIIIITAIHVGIFDVYRLHVLKTRCHYQAAFSEGYAATPLTTQRNASILHVNDVTVGALVTYCEKSK
jgi:hypothetical protein